ncbi:MULTISPECIES: UrcA family protein [unclassified Caulobacter]|jgi:UrcA family protein|uniref:UrcA family protein n=1 Tax=unclassified Caulobacter TaxID=2648921 RepID=UPI0006475E51|nr:MULTISPECIES: UrcA family protein [unclassified Caulobacter]KQV58372.1 UrcA family protein [Caulobacter sp. Root342]KQV69120.1 UrcA family protein [Caulobacter sp. Root343]
MSKIVNRIAVAAALALAATPIIGLSAAHAGQRVEPVARIKVGDLRLSDPTDAREFARRVNIAANRACEAKGLRGLSVKACLMDFGADVQDALNEKQAADLKVAKAAGAGVALAAN